MIKICPLCKVEKDVSIFHKNRTKKDGLAGWCKECSKSEHLKKGYGATRYYLDKKGLYNKIKDWRKNNHKKHLANRRIYYANNKEKFLENKLEWEIRNPLKAKAIRKKQMDSDAYIIRLLSNHNIMKNQYYFTYKKIINLPELIKIHKLYLITKRELKKQILCK